MCKQISTEHVLGSVLYFNQSGISFSQLNDFEKRVYRLNTDLVLDISRNSIVAVLESHKEYFEQENDKLFLKKYYVQNIGRIKQRFVDVIDQPIVEILHRALTSN